jgi:uncharacterized protein YdeI (BOF family)
MPCSKEWNSLTFFARSSLILALSAVLFLPAGLRAVTICEVQDPDSSTGFSKLEGQTVTITAVVTVPPGIFVPQYTSIYANGVGTDSCGVNIFSFERIPGLSLGDTVTVTGLVEEYVSTSGYGSTSEITFDSATDITVRDGDSVPEPTVMRTGHVGREQNEGRFIRVSGQIVTPVAGDEFEIDDGTGRLPVYDRSGLFEGDSTWQNLSIGDEITVQGVVAQSDPEMPYLSDYTIWPRSPELGDIERKQCIPGDSPAAYLSVDRPIFCPEIGERVTVVYDGPHAGRLRLRIIDVYGRTAATLDDRVNLCGQIEFSWDGRDELRQALPMGLYHIVVTATNSQGGGETQESVPVVIGRRLR